MLSVLPVRTPTLPPATHTNCYRLGDTVIDPASPYLDEQERLASWAEGVRRILVTHHHEDHVGGVADLRARTGARVYAHRDARLPFAVDEILDDLDTVNTGDGVLVALHTPGHADGHLAFLVDGTGDVVAGDLVAGVGTIVLVPPEGQLAAYLASLARVRPLATTLHPAHGPACPGALADQYIAHRHMRTGQFLAALRAGARDPESIAHAVYATIPGADLRLAALQVRTHLAWMADEGLAREENGLWTFA